MDSISSYSHVTIYCAICGAGTANSSAAPEFTPGFSGVRVARPFCNYNGVTWFILTIMV
jgi:hypothetical protein